MGLGNLGLPEILLILVIVLLIFGAKRLPEVGSSIGKGIRELKRGLKDTSDAIMRDEEPRNLSSRQMDASQPPASGGDPKRLSQ
jgi:sec-independent protein translocase protein TatA